MSEANEHRTFKEIIAVPEQTGVVNRMIADLQHRFDLGEMNGPDDEFERASIMNAINDAWPYAGQTLLVTGYVTMPVVNLIEQSDEQAGGTTQMLEASEFIRSSVIGLPIISDGFGISSKEVSIGGQHVFNTYAIHHDFKLPIGIYPERDNNADIHPRRIALNCAGMLEDIHIDAYPFETSESIIDKLSYYFPQELEQIEDILQSSDDELAMVKRLGAVALHVNKQLSAQDFSLFDDFFKEYLDMDPAPHLVVLDENGTVFEKNPSGYHLVAHGGLSLLSRLKGIKLLPDARFIDDDSPLVVDGARLVPSLIADVYAPDRKHDITDAVVPLDRIKTITNGRDWLSSAQDTTE